MLLDNYLFKSSVCIYWSLKFWFVLRDRQNTAWLAKNLVAQYTKLSSKVYMHMTVDILTLWLPTSTSVEVLMSCSG